jgi:hypothetical protein
MIVEQKLEKQIEGTKWIQLALDIMFVTLISINFTFMLSCIVIDFFLNNQPDTLIIPNLFCYKTLHVSGIFSVHHQEFSSVHSALVSFMQASDGRFQQFHPHSAWKRSSETCMKLTSAECTVENS